MLLPMVKRLGGQNKFLSFSALTVLNLGCDSGNEDLKPQQQVWGTLRPPYAIHVKAMVENMIYLCILTSTMVTLHSF